MKLTRKVDRTDIGTIDWVAMDENFEHISEDIDDLDTRIKFNESRHPATQTVTYLLESEGYVTILTAKEHANRSMKLVHAFVVAADNIKENVTVHLLRENRDLCDPVTIKSTEKAGKCQSFSPFKTQVIGKMEAVKLYSNNRRKVIVTLVLSVEGIKQ